jgi:hypothetical protein
VALHTTADIEVGRVLSYNYHGNTDDQDEYHNSHCLCGAESCETRYLTFAAGHFDGIMKSHHTMVKRFAMLARACERFAVKSNSISKDDAYLLASVGFGEKIFRESPAWLKCYCAQVVEFIELERQLLPRAQNDCDSEDADGVRNLRLQSLAITIDRVLAFLRRHPDHQAAPLIPQTDLEAARKLVFDEKSIWSTLKEFVESRDRTLPGLKDTLEEIMKCSGKNRQSIEAAREVLRRTATALRSASPTYSPCADVLEVCSITPIFF